MEYVSLAIFFLSTLVTFPIVIMYFIIVIIIFYIVYYMHEGNISGKLRSNRKFKQHYVSPIKIETCRYGVNCFRW